MSWPKSIYNIALYFISTCGEFFICRESFFQLHFSTTLYLIFIFIKIIFLLFYFNFFFSLSSFLFSSSFSTPVTHSTVQNPATTLLLFSPTHYFFFHGSLNKVIKLVQTSSSSPNKNLQAPT